jgi:cytochrome c
MKVRFLSLNALMILLLLVVASSSSAAESAGAEDAKRLLAKAVDYMEKEGAAKAFCAFNNPTGQFHEGPLYVFVINMDGVYFAHSAAPTLVGTSLRDLRDASGQPFGKNIMEVITTHGEGIVDYKWLNYSSNKVEDKHSFVKKVGDLFVLGVGYYTR